MTTSMRPSTLETLGLGTVLEIFKNGKLPASLNELVDRVFGGPGHRGSIVISGANGIVGAGKAMQLGSRLQPFDIPIIALDFPGSPDGIGKQYPGLAAAFGQEQATKVMENVIRFTYGGKTLPPAIKGYEPRFLLEAIPEILELKKAHFKMFRDAFPEIEIKSVTSGFPASQLGVGIAHPAFPHEINKIWEMVEDKPSDVTKLFWAMGMIPLPVSDDWSFVLDVFFCGLTQVGARYHRASNMPFWKIDKLVRRELGPNPFRAHDVIGAAGANFLTWSCLHHLSRHYGALFTPTPELEEKKESGQNWYPLNHFRPLVNWTLDDDEMEDFKSWILGPMIQMTSLMIKENRAHPAIMNAVGELCAQFRSGMPAVVRSMGADAAVNTVNRYHALHPEAGKNAWHPEALESMDSPEWRQLYVNAEHDGATGVISISREAYNSDVNAEMNRAMDWLLAQKIGKVIVTSDFHMSTQMVGADTNEFFPALANEQIGFDIAGTWSTTARRLQTDFAVSVGCIVGKRCLGGMLELMEHCHYLVAVEDASLGMPEVTLPVVPGMEGCHWPFRKANSKDWPKLFKLLLEGRAVPASETVGWLVDFAGPLEDAIRTAWSIASEGGMGVSLRKLEEGPLKGLPKDMGGLVSTAGAAMEGARKAIFDNIIASCQAPLGEALTVQAKHSAGFMTGKLCNKGTIGSMAAKTMAM